MEQVSEDIEKRAQDYGIASNRSMEGYIVDGWIFICKVDPKDWKRFKDEEDTFKTFDLLTVQLLRCA